VAAKSKFKASDYLGTNSDLGHTMQTSALSESPADAALEALAAAQEMNIVHKILIKPASAIHEQVA
jgi:hypothetical protein